jgi:hypothetical protein
MVGRRVLRWSETGQRKISLVTFCTLGSLTVTVGIYAKNALKDLKDPGGSKRMQEDLKDPEGSKGSV